MFVDASRGFEQGKRQNRLREDDIDRIVQGVSGGLELERFAHRATREEITENDYNLNISRYIETFEEEDEVDLATLKVEIAQLEADLAQARAAVAEQLVRLGI